MEKFHSFRKSPIRVLKLTKKRKQMRMRRSFIKLKQALAQEKLETVHMLNTYKAHSKGEASKEDLILAHQQLGDILKGVGLGVFAVLPFAPVTIPIIIKLGKRFGIDILPSAFNQEEFNKKSSKDMVKPSK